MHAKNSIKPKTPVNRSTFMQYIFSSPKRKAKRRDRRYTLFLQSQYTEQVIWGENWLQGPSLSQSKLFWGSSSRNASSHLSFNSVLWARHWFFRLSYVRPHNPL